LLLDRGRHRLGRVKQSAALVSVAAAVLPAVPAGATARTGSVDSARLIPHLYKNCTNFNRRYPHGVGKRFARDKTSGTPVTNFKRSTILYRRATSYNRGLDRDKDGIACEKQ
jgi:Excalibur calcium-binding domain